MFQGKQRRYESRGKARLPFGIVAISLKDVDSDMEQLF